MRNGFILGTLALLLCTSLRADEADRAIDELMAKHPIPGLALEVVKDGKVVKCQGYGYANLEWSNRITPETVFEIGSVTKQFTAAGIMLLQQDGKLSLDDPIAKHIPGTPESWKNITVRHLLTHTSGIKNYTVLDGFELRLHLTQAQFVKQMGDYELDFEPGTQWHYCNSGFSLLGYIIENASGKKYWEFMRERIFVPLQMTSTTNRNPGAVIPFRASGYETDHSGKYINRDYDLTDIFSAGAIVSTIGDLVKWDASLDSKQLLTEQSETAMWTPTKLKNGKIQEYGFGWFLSPLDGHKNIGHSGSTSGFSASNQRFPDDGLVVIVLTNSNEDGIATKAAKEVARLYLKKK